MKRVLLILLTLVMFFSLAGFGSKISNTPAEPTPAPAENTVPEGFATTSYLYESSYGDTLFFLAVKNETDTAVSVSGNAVAKDASGNAIGAGDFSIDILGPGEESLDYVYFSNVSGVDSVSFQLSTKESAYYYPVLSGLDVARYDNPENVSLAITNTGDTAAQYVEAYALFLDEGGEVTGYASTYVTDQDGELKVGDTRYAQLDNYGPYDSAMLYLTGRSDGALDHADSAFDAGQLSVQEYWYENGWGDTLVFLAIDNLSDTDVEVHANAAAKDAAGNVLGADEFTTDVIGPGLESIGYFYFDGVTGADHVDYVLTGDPDCYYVDVLANLDGDARINDNNVVVTLTNVGDIPARYVHVYALFFDADENVVDYDYTYFTDDDGELKPGATLSEQLNTYEEFDSVVLFASGYGDK